MSNRLLSGVLELQELDKVLALEFPMAILLYIHAHCEYTWQTKILPFAVEILWYVRLHQSCGTYTVPIARMILSHSHT